MSSTASSKSTVEGRAGFAFATFLAMTRKELIVMLRYPVQFIASFAQIFAIVAIFALAGLTFSNPSNTDFQETSSGFVIYGFVLFMFMSDTLWSMGYNIRNEQKQGTLEQLYLSPASKTASLISRVTLILVWTGLLVTAASMLMYAILGYLPVNNLPLAGYILLMTLLGTFGVGFAFAALTLRIKDTAQTAANGLQFILLILAAYFFPFSALPEPVLYVSRLLPISYSVDAFRSTLMGYPEGFPELAPIEVELVIITVFALLMPIMGYRFYRWSEHRARSSGSLSEY